MSDNSVKLLEALIDAQPEFEDENGKGIMLGDTRIYLKDGVLTAFLIVFAILVICFVREEGVHVLNQAFEYISDKNGK